MTGRYAACLVSPRNCPELRRCPRSDFNRPSGFGLCAPLTLILGCPEPEPIRFPLVNSASGGAGFGVDPKSRLSMGCFARNSALRAAVDPDTDELLFDIVINRCGTRAHRRPPACLRRSEAASASRRQAAHPLRSRAAGSVAAARPGLGAVWLRTTVACHSSARGRYNVYSGSTLLHFYTSNSPLRVRHRSGLRFGESGIGVSIC